MITEDPLRADEFALLRDRAGRRYLVRLRPGAQFHSHHGILRHDDIIGRREGACCLTSLTRPLWVYRPRMQDYVMHMPRSSAIVYPKDIAVLLLWADIFPGARVLEAGAGSGALALALLRTIGPQGQLVTYDIRSDMLEQAQRNIQNFLGSTLNWFPRVQDIYQGIDDGPFDRIVLDVPEPGRVAPHAPAALTPGGILCSYVPNVPQAQASVEAYRRSGAFVDIQTYEVLLRPWVFQGPSARPSHATIGHTGFLTFARQGEGPPTHP